MDFNFSIYFGESVTSEYERAIEYASMFDKFSPIGPDSNLNFIETSNHEILAKYLLFQKLMNTIGSWDSAGVSYRNKEKDPISFYMSIKDTVECSQGCMNAVNQTAYCNDKDANCWGCRKLTGIVMQHSESHYSDFYKYWYQFGTFKNKTTWVINKDELSQALIEIVEKKNIDFCPIFQYVFFRKIVAELPSVIDASDSKNWGMIYLDSSISNVNRWEAINVYHKSSLPAPIKEKKVTGKDTDTENSDNLEEKKPEDINLRYIPETNFNDVGGIEDIIQSIREVIELPIIKPELFEHLGIRPYRGILLWGEPGNGKTLIAKAIAHEVNAHFIPIVGPDILNKSFGESEKNLREIFEEAREFQPSIIFIDEIDAIAQSRLAGETAKWYATVVNQLLSLMDGIKEYGNVTVMASTNRPDLLDPALLRPGRFDYKLEIRRPKLHGCKTILDIATREMPLADDVDLFSVAEAVVGYSAAEITFVAKEAAMAAMRRTTDLKSILRGDDATSDFSHLVVKQIDFFNSLMILKWHSKYVNKTYSLK